MHRRVSPLWLTIIACCAVLLAPLSTAFAAPKDAEAEKLYSQAMDDDYLNTKFDDAISKLKKAEKACGAKGCSGPVLAKVYVGLGVIYGGGKNNNAEAKKYFIKAFQADPKAQPLDFYMTDELKKLFAQAGQEAGDDDDDDDGDDDDDDDDDDGDDDDDDGDDDDDDDDGAGGDMEFEPPKEALVNTPLPIFVKVPEDLNPDSVKVKYKPFGGTTWQSVKMRRMNGGFGGIVPCADVTTTGDLKLYVLVKDKEGDSIATAGTRKRPLVVKIKNQIDGKQPSLPGEKPPEKCQTAADCPPDFPGCTPTKTPGGGKGWGASCEENKECREGLICLNGFCEQGEAGDDDDDDDDDGKSGDAPLNFFTLGAQLDLMVINSAENVCGTADSATAGFSQSLDNYFCYTDTGEYLGKPAAGAFNEVQGGLGLSGVRILLGYDRILWKGLAVGVRAGFVIGGAPGPGDAADRFAECDGTGADCHESRAATFPPIHGELRGSYFIPSAGGFLDGLLQPYAFIGGGIGRVDAGVPVALCDYVESDGYTPVGGAGDDNCPAGTSQRDNVKAYQISGLGFMDFGIGTIIGFHPMFGVSVEAKFMLMLPTVGFVVSPNIAPVFMF